MKNKGIIIVDDFWEDTRPLRVEPVVKAAKGWANPVPTHKRSDLHYFDSSQEFSACGFWPYKAGYVLEVAAQSDPKICKKCLCAVKETQK